MVQRGHLIKGPWQVYDPGKDYNVIFIEFEGNDWYKYREYITSKYLVVFYENGEILDVYTDISRAFPGGLYSAEVNEIPEDFDKGQYRFGESGFYRYVPTEAEVLEKNKRIQERGYKMVSEEINHLMMLQGLQVISEEETKRLATLTDFVKALREVDLTNPAWPDLQ